MSRALPRSRQFQGLQTSAAEADPLPGETIIKGAGALDVMLRQIEQIGGSVGWRAIIFHLSRLQRAHRAEKHLLIAANMLEDVVREHNGRLFLLPNNDLAVICKGIKAKSIESAEETLRYLFNDDRFAQKTEVKGGLSTCFNLEKDHLACLRVVRKQLTAEPGRKEPLAREAATGEAPASAALDPARAADLLKAVSRLDLSPMLRRQTTWKLTDGRTPEAHSEEVFVSVKSLREAVGPAFDAASDRQLFGYLTRWLDRYILRTLSWEHYSVGAPLSFNINLATIGSPEFAAFDKRRPATWHDRIMLEFQLGDIWADLPAYLKIGQRLKRDGYIRCLDGVVFSALPFLNLRRLDVDYIKVIWDESLLTLGETALRELCQSIADCGTERIILTRCDREEALKIGSVLGIQLFQGWHVNSGQANPGVKVGHAVDVTYADGRQKIGTVREVRGGKATVLLGGAETQASIDADVRSLRSIGPERWLLKA